MIMSGNERKRKIALQKKQVNVERRSKWRAESERLAFELDRGNGDVTQLCYYDCYMLAQVLRYTNKKRF